MMNIILLLSFGFVFTYADELLIEYQESNVKFTSNTYKELSKSASGNILMCPLSVQIVMAMVFAGAKSETAKELSTATNLPNNPERVVEMFSKITPQLESNDKYTFESANKIYVQNKYKVQKQYEEVISNAFKGEIENIDFLDSEAAATMNRWVKETTHYKISDLINQNDLNEDSRLMIVNAMYFKGQWALEFESSETTRRPFYVNNTHYIDTDMMSNHAKYHYYEDSELDAKFLQIPYQGDDVVLIIALPNNPANISKLENNMDSVLKPKFEHPVKIHIRIPKLEIKSTIKFKEILQPLGAVLPFSNGAEFDGMINAHEQLKIAEVVQKTAIEIDEKGTVASAASAAHVHVGRILQIYPNIYFYADHPFVYFIKHKTLGVTFVGRYIAPTGTIKSGQYIAPVNDKYNKVQVPV